MGIYFTGNILIELCQWHIIGIILIDYVQDYVTEIILIGLCHDTRIMLMELYGGMVKAQEGSCADFRQDAAFTQMSRVRIIVSLPFGFL